MGSPPKYNGTKPGYKGSYCWPNPGELGCTSGNPFDFSSYGWEEFKTDLVHRPAQIQDSWNNGTAEEYPLTRAPLVDGTDCSRSSPGDACFKTDYWDGMKMTRWTSENWKIPVIAVCIYLVGLAVLLKVMKGRGPIDRNVINPVVACWNLGLSIFSFCGVYYTVPHLINNLSEHTFRDTVCFNAQWYGHGYEGFWVGLFIYSKLVELFDTLWLVLKKRCE
eukprot:SAG22_NODE_1756_length_3651_cov_52.815315_1_plen_220_part_00